MRCKVGHVLDELPAVMANIVGQSSSIVGGQSKLNQLMETLKLMCIRNNRLDGVMFSYTVLNLFFQFILVWLLNVSPSLGCTV